MKNLCARLVSAAVMPCICSVSADLAWSRRRAAAACWLHPGRQPARAHAERDLPEGRRHPDAPEGHSAGDAHQRRDALSRALLDRSAAGHAAATERAAAAAESDEESEPDGRRGESRGSRTASPASSTAATPTWDRDLEFLKQLTTQSGLPIVASGGYYMERVYPPELATKSEDQIAEELAREAAANRFGAFGEIGENPNAPMSELERKVFRAVGKAHVRTNLPIFTHNAYGTGPNVPADAGLRQLDVLESVGVKPQRIADRPHLLPRRSEGRHHQADCEARRVRRVRSRHRRSGAGRQESHDGARVPRGRYADQLLICSDFTGRRSAARPGLRQHGDGVRAEAAAGWREGRDRARDPLRQPAALSRVRAEDPVGAHSTG